MVNNQEKCKNGKHKQDAVLQFPMGEMSKQWDGEDEGQYGFQYTGNFNILEVLFPRFGGRYKGSSYRHSLCFIHILQILICVQQQ